MTDEPKRVILIDGGHRGGKTLRILALMQAYGARGIKQGQVAGEYPAPVVDIETTEVNGDPVFSYNVGGGTVTGRFSASKPNFREMVPSRDNEPAVDERTRDICKNMDFSKIEERVLAHMSEPLKDLGRFNCRGDYVVPDEHPADNWVGVDKRALSEFDQARRFVDLYSMGPTKLGVPVAVPHADHWKQLEAASASMIEWAAKMRADGYEPEGDGPLSDSWVKKRSVIDLPKMLEDAGIDANQLPGWEMRVSKQGCVQDPDNSNLWSKEDDDATD